jgi:hypothetical protein
MNGHPEDRFVVLGYPHSAEGPALAPVQWSSNGYMAPPLVVDNYDVIFYEPARRLGHEILRLWAWDVDMNYHDYDRYEAQFEIEENIDKEHNLQQGKKNLSLVQIAQPLHKATGDKRRLDERVAAELLRKKIIEEQHQNHEPRDPDYPSLWSWTANLPAKNQDEKFFNLDRWPVELQTQERQDEILFTGPAPRPESIPNNRPSPKYQEAHGKELNVFQNPKRERYYPRQCFFPFGETIFQQMYQSRKIDEHLSGGGYSFPNFDN